MNQYGNQVPPPGAVPMMVVQNPDGTSYLVPIDQNAGYAQPQYAQQPVYVQQQPGYVATDQYVQQPYQPNTYQQPGGYVSPSGPVPSANYPQPSVVPNTPPQVQPESSVEIESEV